MPTDKLFTGKWLKCEKKVVPLHFRTWPMYEWYMTDETTEEYDWEQ